jgi:hypothetical protein
MHRPEVTRAELVQVRRKIKGRASICVKHGWRNPPVPNVETAIRLILT